MGFLHKIGEMVGVVSADQSYTEQQNLEYLDGFCTTYPLQNQPMPPVHCSVPYVRGLFTGARATMRHGVSHIPYEGYETDEEIDG
jgi:hypothetical protein